VAGRVLAVEDGLSVCGRTVTEAKQFLADRLVNNSVDWRIPRHTRVLLVMRLIPVLYAQLLYRYSVRLLSESHIRVPGSFCSKPFHSLTALASNIKLSMVYSNHMGLI